MASNQCFAYKMLKKQIGQQCKIYGRLRQKGDLGSLPGMYKKSEDLNDMIPSDDVSAFFRGGIINTMACFEAYVVDLLDEACDTILYQRKKCLGTCEDCQQLRYDHVIRKKESQPLDEAKDTAKENSQQDLKKKALEKEKYRAKDFYPRIKGLSDEEIEILEKGEAEQNPQTKQSKEKQEIFENYESMKEEMTSRKTKHDVNQRNPILLHKWNEKYSDVLSGPNYFVSSIFQGGGIKYYYPIDGNKISKVIIKDKVVVCAMLRLFYGIRCIMGHGNDGTLNNSLTLKEFPFCEACFQQGHKQLHCITSHKNPDDSINKQKFKKCEKCQNDTLSILDNISQLSATLDTCITQMGKKKVLKKSRHFPRRETFERLANEEKAQQAEWIIEKYDLDIDRINSGPGLVNENYAYFHMCRILHWLKENKRMMYVTYRVLVRINQFILVLAYRMRIAVAQILMEKHGLEDGIWNVPEDKEKLKKKIEKFEKKHKERVESLQKHDGAENRVVVNNMQRKCNCQTTIQNDNNKTIIVLIICSSFIIVCVQLSIIIFKLTQ